MNNNGFEDFAKLIAKMTPQKADILAAEKEAAEFYLAQLLPHIPKSLMTKRHMADNISVKIMGDEVKVIFGDTAYYWRFVENGTSKQRAQNFARNTLNGNEKKIAEIMTQQLLERMGL